MNDGPWGYDLIMQKLDELGGSKNQLARKIGVSYKRMDYWFHHPDSLPIRYVRAISGVLGLTAPEIYNSFILLWGWREETEDEGLDD